MKLAILVSGWGSPTGIEWKFSPIYSELFANGYDVMNLRPRVSGTGDIRRAAKQLARVVASLREDYEYICVVGHSMGGLVARYGDYICNKRGTCIDAVCTLGSPHGGTMLANLALFSASARQMGTRAGLIKKLADMPRENFKAQYYCIGAGRDELVWPRSSALWPEAEEIEMFDTNHIGLIYSTTIAKNVVEFFNDTDKVLY
jgi:pimeloyl-ACP methyl ester carboxylesterase